MAAMRPPGDLLRRPVTVPTGPGREDLVDHPATGHLSLFEGRPGVGRLSASSGGYAWIGFWGG